MTKNGSRIAAKVSGSYRVPRLVAGIGLVACVLHAPAVAGSSPGGAPVPEAGARSESGGAVADTDVILITGSTGGLGRELARELARSGAHVIIHGRDRERGAALVREIEEEGTGSARFYAADFAELDQVRELAEAVLRDYDRLDVLVNNAGIWLQDEERRLSADGHELHFQVNYLAHYLLTRILLPRIVESAPARIVNVASTAQRPIDFDDVMMERDYSDSRGYAQSKLAQVLFTYDLARELDGAEVLVTALHPATLMDTDMVLSRGMEPRAGVEEGTEAVLRLVTAPDVQHGRYHRGTESVRAHDQAYDEDARAALRRLSEELSGR